MADYLIKDIPEDTMRDFKTACAHFKETMRKTLLDMMEISIAAYKVDMNRIKAKPPTRKKKEKTK